MSKKFLKTFVIPVTVGLNRLQHDEARKLINIELVGDEVVNEMGPEGYLVGKYDDHPNAQKLLEAHRKLAVYQIFHFEFGVKVDGGLHFIREIS